MKNAGLCGNFNNVQDEQNMYHKHMSVLPRILELYRINSISANFDTLSFSAIR